MSSRRWGSFPVGVAGATSSPTWRRGRGGFTTWARGEVVAGAGQRGPATRVARGAVRPAAAKARRPGMTSGSSTGCLPSFASTTTWSCYQPTAISAAPQLDAASTLARLRTFNTTKKYQLRTSAFSGVRVTGLNSIHITQHQIALAVSDKDRIALVVPNRPSTSPEQFALGGHAQTCPQRHLRLGRQCEV